MEEFDPWLFVPSYLYVSRWKSAQDRLFPSKGERVYIFLAGEDRLDWSKLDHLVTNLENQTDILTQVDSWFIHFKEYWEYNFKTNEGDCRFILTLGIPTDRNDSKCGTFTAPKFM